MSIKINAAARLSAAANQEQAKALLTSLGFGGLSLNHSGDEQIAFNFSKFDQAALTSQLGKPNKSFNVLTWKYKNVGKITVMPKSKTVYLFNNG